MSHAITQVSLRKLFTKKIGDAFNQIAEEEAALAAERTKKRALEMAAKVLPQLMSRIGWRESQYELTVVIPKESVEDPEP